MLEFLFLFDFAVSFDVSLLLELFFDVIVPSSKRILTEGV